MLEYKLQLSEVIAYLFLGVLFFTQGCDEVLNIKISGVVDNFLADAKHLQKKTIHNINLNWKLFYCKHKR